MALTDNTKTHIQLAILNKSIQESNKTQERLIRTVYGDGNGEKGLVVRTDRIEQKTKWIQAVIATPIVGFAIKFLMDIFTK